MKKKQQILVSIISLIILAFFVETSWADVSNIYGTVSGDVADDVTITLTGFSDEASPTIYNELTKTEINGDYGFTVKDGSYTITPSMAGYSFTPANTTVTIEGADVSGIDFTSVADEAVWVGDYQLLNSDDIAALSGYTEVTGDLAVGPWTSDPDADSTLKDLTGLESLTTIGGNLRIYFNPVLSSLSGLENLTSLGGNLFIDMNPVLASLSALSNLTRLNGYLTIVHNYALTNLNGLENITSLEWFLVMRYNYALTSISALSNLTSVGGQLNIGFNTSLTSLNGLENITSVDNSLMIEGNDVLTSLSGLENLINVHKWLWIIDNYALTDLSALYEVKLGGNNLKIYDNEKLSMDTAYALETQLRSNGFTGTADIYNNNGGLESVLSGTVSGDVQEGVTITLKSVALGSTETTITAGDGTYSFTELSNGEYIVTPSLEGYSFTPANTPVTIDGADQTGVDFVSEAVVVDDDFDDDGVFDDFDECEDTPIDEIVNSYGCSIEQLIPCEGPRETTETWRNHGKYVSALAKTANSFVNQGLITEEEKDDLMEEMASSDCGM